MSKRKIINMFWYKMPSGEKNFGDDLGPYLVSTLSGQEICYVPIINSKFKTAVLYFKGLLSAKYSIKDFLPVFNGAFKNQVLVTIGSIVSNFNNSKTDVWGAGLMFKNAIIHKANFHAVRGKYTQHRLKELGFKAPNAIGDPALLLPLIIPANKIKKHKLGIIPHYIHYDKVLKACADKNILVINLLDDIEKVILDITSCEYTISTSLHGLIVSHSYLIPSLWYEFPDAKLAGDNVKFADYFSSVNIEEYPPYKLSDYNIDEILANVIDNGPRNSIQNNLFDIQKDLIRAAPFTILDKYQL